MKHLLILSVAMALFLNRSLVLTAEDSDTYLSEEIQAIVNDVAEEYCICPELVLAIIEAESSGRVAVVNELGCTGLMQINPKAHPDRIERLGVTDLTDAEQNIRVGCDYLAKLFSEYGDLYPVLAAYHGGEYSQSLKDALDGKYSNYVLSVSARSEQLEREHGK